MHMRFSCTENCLGQRSWLWRSESKIMWIEFIGMRPGPTTKPHHAEVGTRCLGCSRCVVRAGIAKALLHARDAHIATFLRSRTLALDRTKGLKMLA